MNRPVSARGSNQYVTRFGSRGPSPTSPDPNLVNSVHAVGGRVDLLDDPGVRIVAERFSDHNVDVYVVGGAVRDRLCGRPAKDVDLCTPASPEQIKRLLSPLGRLYEMGEKFGTIGVNIPGCGDYEVTTFRGERYTSGSRKPDVDFGVDLHDDLARRDFTVNAIAWNPTTGHIVDPLNGVPDLHSGVLRAPGDPYRRFEEDPLRIARLARFAVTYRFEPDTATETAAQQLSSELGTVSRERRHDEAVRMLTSPQPDAFERMLRFSQRLRIDRYLFGQIDVVAARHVFKSDPGPAARLAALCWVTRSADPAAELHVMTYPRDEIKAATRIVHAVNDIVAADRIGLRRVIRTYTDDELVAAEAILDAAQQPPSQRPSQMTPPQRARWREPLPVNGNDFTAIGLKGPAVGDALRHAEKMFLAGVTDRQVLLDGPLKV